MKTLTLEYLKTHKACEEGIKLFKASGLEGFPLKDLDKVEGDFNGFVSWLKRIEACQYEYNDQGLMTKKVTPFGDVWLYEYNDQGLMTKKVTPSGNVWLWEYNDQGLMTKEVSPSGRVWLYEYNDQGLIAKMVTPSGRVWLYEYNDQGLKTKKVDPDGNVWLYEYNDQGLKTKSVTPSGDVWLWEYNDQGLKTKSVTPSGRVWLYEYNDQGLMTKEVTPSGDVWLYEYNDQGLMTKRVTPFSGVTTRGYTFKNGQLTEITENKIPVLTIPLFKKEDYAHQKYCIVKRITVETENHTFSFKVYGDSYQDKSLSCDHVKERIENEMDLQIGYQEPINSVFSEVVRDVNRNILQEEG